jgi:hypothetical protein
MLGAQWMWRIKMWCTQDPLLELEHHELHCPVLQNFYTAYTVAQGRWRDKQGNMHMTT